MSKKLNITRRKALGALGTIGIASAGAGLGTTAFFSDTESFDGNSVTAGELDMKIDWEEHYSDWLPDTPGGQESPQETDDATMADDPMTADYYLPAVDVPDGFAGAGSMAEGGIHIAPTDASPIALNFTTSQDDFWDGTAIEAYPDEDDDGLQDSYDEGQVCSGDILADLPGEEDDSFGGDLDSDRRTEGSRGDALIDLSDVKPGDFGEVTFSFHLCDNPGYVWLTGAFESAAENGITEPEAEDPQEDGDDVVVESMDDADYGKVELLDNILTRAWYDDGNNQVDPLGGDADVVCAVDTSGSIQSEQQTELQNGVNEFINALDGTDADARVGVLSFGDGEVTIDRALQSTTGSANVSLTFGGGDTPMPGALDIADQLVRGADNARSGAEKVIVLFTDGGPNYEGTFSYSASAEGTTYDAPRDDTTDWSAESDGSSLYDNADGGTGNVSKGEMDETKGVASSIQSGSIGGGSTRIATVYSDADGNPTEAMTQGAINEYTDLPMYLVKNIATSPDDAVEVNSMNAIADLAGDIAQIVATSEEVFFFGTLRQALEMFSDGKGVPLDGDLPAEQGGGSGRNCFSAETTHYIGFEWWLPINHGNQVQGDSVSFDVGFYTEQCRHNDGSGQSASS